MDVVYHLAKIQIFKQITTDVGGDIDDEGLFIILQRYKFSSKSQPPIFSHEPSKRCLSSCKDTNFQANHNGLGLEDGVGAVVYHLAKIQIFKQITTSGAELSGMDLLFIILQRYKFSSKSQHVANMVPRFLSCLSSCKDTNFQANHNIL